MQSTKWPSVNVYIRQALGDLRIAAFLIFVAADKSPLMLLGVLLIFQLPSLAYSAMLLRTLRHTPVESVRYSRPTTWSISYRMLFYLPLALLLYLSIENTWTFEAIGYSPNSSWLASVVVGIVAAYFTRRLITVADGLLWRSDSASEDSTLTAFDASVVRQHLPRGRARWLSVLDTIVLGPIAEDVVYRGFFVYFGGNLFGEFPSIVFGLLLCVWMHLYQGPRRMIAVVVFFAVSVSLLYSPLGLLAVIAFHAASNAYAVAMLRPNGLRYLQHQRERRVEANRRRITPSGDALVTE